MRSGFPARSLTLLGACEYDSNDKKCSVGDIGSEISQVVRGEVGCRDHAVLNLGRIAKSSPLTLLTGPEVSQCLLALEVTNLDRMCERELRWLIHTSSRHGWWLRGWNLRSGER